TLENIAKITEAKPSKSEIEEGVVFSNLEVVIISQEEKKVIQEHIESIDEVTQVQLEMLVETLESVQLKDIERGPSREAEPGSIQSVRVQLSHLDQMMNLLGELVITRNAMTQLLDLSGPQAYLFNEMDKTILELRTLILKTRLVPLQYIYEHYPRLVREAIKGSNKKITLMLGGKDLEVDRTIIDYLNEALIHLIRNAINHGIEDKIERERLGKPIIGQIELKAQIERNDILISIEDDGRGIDLDLVRKKAIEQGYITPDIQLDHDGIIALLFLSGFSTSEKLTDLSGRGIGMTIVYNNVVEKMNGSISVDTEKDVGTLITIRLPRSIAIMEALIVRADSREVAIPMGNIFRVYQIQDRQVFYHNERPFVVVNKEIIPVLTLGDTFIDDNSGDLGTKNSESLESINKAVIIWERAGKKIGVLVDAILAQQQIVLKKMDRLLSQVKGFSGVTLMGEGTLIPVIDPTQLVGGV
ncbi:MAG: ATP-binding protein, partial [Candidatus Hodarchaeota archaeon]